MDERHRKKQHAVKGEVERDPSPEYMYPKKIRECVETLIHTPSAHILVHAHKMSTQALSGQRFHF